MPLVSNSRQSGPGINQRGAARKTAKENMAEACGDPYFFSRQFLSCTPNYSMIQKHMEHFYMASHSVNAVSFDGSSRGSYNNKNTQSYCMELSVKYAVFLSILYQSQRFLECKPFNPAGDQHLISSYIINKLLNKQVMRILSLILNQKPFSHKFPS